MRQFRSTEPPSSHHWRCLTCASFCLPKCPWDFVGDVHSHVYRPSVSPLHMLHCSVLPTLILPWDINPGASGTYTEFAGRWAIGFLNRQTLFATTKKLKSTFLAIFLEPKIILFLCVFCAFCAIYCLGGCLWGQAYFITLWSLNECCYSLEFPRWLQFFLMVPGWMLLMLGGPNCVSVDQHHIKITEGSSNRLPRGRCSRGLHGVHHTNNNDTAEF